MKDNDVEYTIYQSQWKREVDYWFSGTHELYRFGAKYYRASSMDGVAVREWLVFPDSDSKNAYLMEQYLKYGNRELT